MGSSRATERVARALRLYQRVYLDDDVTPSMSSRKRLRMQLDALLKELEVEETSAYYYGVKAMKAGRDA